MPWSQSCSLPKQDLYIANIGSSPNETTVHGLSQDAGLAVELDVSGD